MIRRSYQRRILWALKNIKRTVYSGVEVGVWKGETSRFLLENYPNLHLYMVDRYQKYQPDEPSNRIAKESQDGVHRALVNALEITNFAHERRTVIIDTSLGASQLFHRQFDFAYLDAGHDYRNVWQDLINYTPKILPGGIIMGDDYGGPADRVGYFGVRKAVNEYFSKEKKKVNVYKRYRIWWVQI